MKRFYSTTFTFTVLSEEPVHNSELGDLLWACDEGPCVMHSFDVDSVRVVTPKQMADLLYEAASDPGFFNLNNEDYEEQ